MVPFIIAALATAAFMVVVVRSYPNPNQRRGPKLRDRRSRWLPLAAGLWLVLVFLGLAFWVTHGGWVVSLCGFLLVATALLWVISSALGG